MKILLIGYGKMGKAIESIASKRGHQIIGKIDVENENDLKKISEKNIDVAIEFTHPSSAFSNIKTVIENNIPIVVGTTGWTNQKPEIESLVKSKNGSFCYSTNYSVGVNIFWALNERLAELMNLQTDYDVTMEETHHVYKKDAPSGTAISTAEGILKHLNRKSKWTNDRENLTVSDLYIQDKREHNIPGTHNVLYTSGIDSIELKHTAFNREGFATGAVLAAEFITNRKGIFSMKDVLGI